MVIEDSKINPTDTVGEIVARKPMLSRIFEEAGIDYCCGGKKPLEKACREKGIAPSELIARLEKAKEADEKENFVDAAAMGLVELVDHIEKTHHAYLRSELARLSALTKKAAAVHGEKDARLRMVEETYHTLACELSSHMMKEEKELFPMVRELEANKNSQAFRSGSAGELIPRLEGEHHQAGEALARLRELTGGYTPPEWACNTYRAMLDALARLERDLHQHIHKENNILFPKTIAVEKTQTR